ncbi:MAG TPA: lipopolysaccharide heptosyltransferase II [Smithella sp.]|nr:lipopolysaccharide heptosyltransferase II [Smithella sp.]HNY51010.1 lipopolysaccharide heptosyltransferase II [Smithella sp.]HOG91118.1 lipopolysaccharide heptosyltransferase II [Smithella sp.]HOU50898.1 lipopolysaccharide heptosyltransferase II [Smithella sp.]HQG65601.1 lipopolysaccharide heptosyltransferase II [Smithella sp.]
MKQLKVSILPKKRFNKILIRGTNWIGDAIMTLPAVASIRATYPQAHIAMLAKPLVVDIYKTFSDLDEIIIYENKFDHSTGVFALARILRDKKFEAAILLQNAIEAAIIALAARIPVRAGYDSDARGLLLSHSVRRTKAIRKVHQVDYYLEMVKALGCVPVDQEMHLEDRINLSDVQQILKKFIPDPQKAVIGIAPGATYGPAKKWFPERFAAVAGRLSEKFSAQVILMGGKADAETAREVQRLAGKEFINLCGMTSVREAVYLISQCRLFISNDSGLMHVAGALNVPTVAIFGSTNPVTTAPAGRKSVIVHHEVPCSPCLKKECPSDFRCMELISVEDVLKAASKLLEEKHEH